MAGTKLRNPDDGEIYDVPEADVPAALSHGYTVSQRLVNPDDNAEYDVPETDVEAALGVGYRRPGAPPVPEPDAATQEATEAPAQTEPDDSSGLGRTVLTGLQGLTRYAGGDVIRAGLNTVETTVQDALGASPETRAKYDLFQDRAQVLENKEAHPTAAKVGEVAGIIGTAVGPALAARIPGIGAGVAAGAKFLPANALNSLGAATAAKVSAKLLPEGAGLLARGAAAVPALIAQGAVEGIGFAVADELNSAFLRGEYASLAEKFVPNTLEILKAGGVGALANLAVGGVVAPVVKGAVKGASGLLSGVSRLGKWASAGAENKAAQGVSRADRELSDRLAEAADQAAASRAIDAAEDTAATTVATDAASAAQAVDENVARLARKANEVPLELAEKAEGARLHRSAVVDGTKSIRAKQNELLKISALFDEQANRISKQRLNKELNGWGAKVSSPETSEVVTGIAAKAKELLSDGGETIYAPSGGAASLKHVSKIADAFQKRVSGKLAAGDIGDAYNALDNFKLILGRMQRSRDGAVREFAEQAYEQTRLHLEDEALWGPLAERQRVFNAVLSKQISAEQADGIQSLFANSGEKNTFNPWENFTETNDSAVKGLLSELGSGLEQREDSYRNWLGVLDASLTTRADVMQNPGLVKDAARAKELVRGIVDDMDNVTFLRRGADEFAEAKALYELTPTVTLFGNSVDAKVALKIADMTAQFRIAERQAGQRSSEVAANKAVREVAKAQEQLNQAAANSDWWKAGAQVARGVAATAGALKQGVNKSLQLVDPVRRAAVLGTVKSVIDSADRLADPDSDDSKDLQSSLRVMKRELGPEMAAAYASQLQRKNAFLLEKAGPVPPRTVFDGAPERAFADDTLASMERYIDATDHPIDAMKRIASRQSTPEDRETVNSLYSSMFKEFQGKILANLADAKTQLSYSEKLGLSEALGLSLLPEQQGESVAFWESLSEPTEMVDPSNKQFKNAAAKAPSKGDRLGA